MSLTIDERGAIERKMDERQEMIETWTKMISEAQNDVALYIRILVEDEKGYQNESQES